MVAMKSVVPPVSKLPGVNATFPRLNAVVVFVQTLALKPPLAPPVLAIVIEFASGVLRVRGHEQCIGSHADALLAHLGAAAAQGRDPNNTDYYRAKKKLHAPLPRQMRSSLGFPSARRIRGLVRLRSNRTDRRRRCGCASASAGPRRLWMSRLAHERTSCRRLRKSGPYPDGFCDRSRAGGHVAACYPPK